MSMTIEEYSNLSLVTEKQGTQNEVITHHLFGMVGEWLSEIYPELDAMSKKDFIDEIGDFMWYFVGYMRNRNYDFSFVAPNDGINEYLKHLYSFEPVSKVSSFIGELVEAEKKVIFYNKVTEDDYRYSYCSNIYNIIKYNVLPKYNVTFDEIFEYNINKLKKRFPDGFNELDAISKKELNGE